MRHGAAARLHGQGLSRCDGVTSRTRATSMAYPGASPMTRTSPGVKQCENERPNSCVRSPPSRRPISRISTCRSLRLPEPPSTPARTHDYPIQQMSSRNWDGKTAASGDAISGEAERCRLSSRLVLRWRSPSLFRLIATASRSRSRPSGRRAASLSARGREEQERADRRLSWPSLHRSPRPLAPERRIIRRE